MAFFHRNTSESRKGEILEDLKLPLDSPNKQLLAVVATVSLGNYKLGSLCWGGGGNGIF